MHRNWQAQDWDALSDATQLTLSQQAMRRAAETIADQAELLAREMDCGSLDDLGGAEALRLFAAVVRVGSGAEHQPVAGHA